MHSYIGIISWLERVPIICGNQLAQSCLLKSNRSGDLLRETVPTASVPFGSTFFENSVHRGPILRKNETIRPVTTGPSTTSRTEDPALEQVANHVVPLFY